VVTSKFDGDDNALDAVHAKVTIFLLCRY